MEHGHIAEQFHDFGFHKVLLVVVPFGTFEEETGDVCTILGLLSNIRNRARSGNKVESKLIDRWTLIVLSGELLQQTSGETSRVSISRNPMHARRIVDLVAPRLEELIPFAEVNEPIAQILERKVSETPSNGNSVL